MKHIKTLNGATLKKSAAHGEEERRPRRLRRVPDLLPVRL